METALLIDMGSTFTKVTLLDLENLEIAGKSQSYTTVNEGVNQGLKKPWQKYLTGKRQNINWPVVVPKAV